MFARERVSRLGEWQYYVCCINIHERRTELHFFRLLMFETRFVPLYDGESWYGLV